VKSVTPLPINYSTLGYGPQGAVPANGLVDYAPGPSALNVGWTLREQYQDRWIFWQPTGGGMRGSIWTPGFETSDTAGQSLLFFPGETVGRFTTCFDATGYPIAATTNPGNQVRLQSVNNQAIVEYTWPGYSPRLLNMAGLVWQDADLLVAVYYIGLDGKIKCRYQLNEYNLEVTICDPATPVKELTKVDYIDRRICLWATSSAANRRNTRQVLFRTPAYENLPTITMEDMSIATEPQGAVASGNIVSSGTFTDTPSVALEPQGAVTETIIEVTITPESATLDMEPAGDVTDVTVDAGSFPESATVAMEPQGASVEVIESVPPVAESGTVTLEPQGLKTYEAELQSEHRT
jgi:hypothetical protein